MNMVFKYEILRNYPPKEGCGVAIPPYMVLLSWVSMAFFSKFCNCSSIGMDCKTIFETPSLVFISTGSRLFHRNSTSPMCFGRCFCSNSWIPPVWLVREWHWRIQLCWHEHRPGKTLLKHGRHIHVPHIPCRSPCTLVTYRSWYGCPVKPPRKRDRPNQGSCLQERLQL